ncbi:hypothetical protein [Pleomorphomonas koreensis]|uniref:hypothetical protein n=1 Tax=Pleomorphomonas koreensis TaxID=257440 RepID=UPI0003FDAF9F|nr:hypothetical protein [Pleomorphomonas koreensis]
MSRRLPVALAGSGLIAGLLTTAWWWIVYSRQIDAGSMPIANALPCLARKTDVCSLAEALCAQTHFLGITRYAPAAFWLSAALLAAGLILIGRRSLSQETQT